MCGFCGFVTYDKSKDNLNILKNITELIKRRGPDSKGYFTDKSDQIYLGHRRLSILDLSSKGNQPMIDPTKNYILGFNGEIYNHLELRKLFSQNYNWNGMSDTETLLMLLIKIGVKKTLEKIEGMFSFIFFDLKNKNFYIARDRFGEKPLYYGWSKNNFLFSSELKSIIKNPHFEKIIDPKVLNLYLNLNYVPTPYSIYKNIYKLEPGSFQKYRVFENKVEQLEKVKYWDLVNIKKNSYKNKLILKNPEEIIQLSLEKSVKKQLISDVPIGSFLSGGIDSSLITSIMQKFSTNKINTFSIGFEEDSYDESKYARKVAEYIGTNHYSEILTANKSIEIIDKLKFIYDEPFSDSSQIPTIFLSSITSKHVKVALTGDGGDEIFGGYNRYVISKFLQNKFSKLPSIFRVILSNFLKSFSINSWDNILQIFNFVIPNNLNFSQKGDKIHKLAEIIKKNNNLDIYLSLISNWQWSNKILNFDNSYNNFPIDKDLISDFSELDQMMTMDAKNYLTDDILVKVDRASMYSSLETRTPFLDKELVENSINLNQIDFINKNESKVILKKILKKYIPGNLYERPKKGFGIPIGKWIREDMKDWSKSLLSKNSLDNHGYFNSKLINQILDDHLKGKVNNEYKLWNLLMFQTWYEEYK